ncbi:MAG: YfiT family bacillithiol transferase [Bacteroidota bacterium]
MDPLKYPIGKFTPPTTITAAHIQVWLSDFRQLPLDFKVASQQIAANGQLDTPYRPGGWTARQVIHHVADSHVNSYMRFKLALTEDHPTIRPYEEAEWAKLPDYQLEPKVSLILLTQIHARLGHLLAALSPAQWERTFVHPAQQKTATLGYNIGMYAWHGRHHLGHLQLILAH